MTPKLSLFSSANALAIDADRRREEAAESGHH
jgi:hypothetical protein